MPVELVTVAQYRLVTIDTTSSDAAVTAALQTAEDLLEEYLRRPLPEAERTETLQLDKLGRIYPSAAPITAVPAGYTIRGTAVFGGDILTNDTLVYNWSYDWSAANRPRSTITYTGGWTAATLPETIRQVIAQVAYDLLHPSPTTVPAGATSVSTGDASMTFGPDGGSPVLSASARRAVRDWRRRD